MAPADGGQSLPVVPSVPLGTRTRLTLHMGVVVQPYRTRRALTTGDVAAFLEKRYGLMEAFFRVHQDDIVGDLENSLQGAMETLLMRRRPGLDPWARGMQAIQQRFRDFIATKEAERVGILGTPTKAALRGVNHRLKHPYSSRNPRRPSFRDTALYMTSYRAWID